jgi:alkanesulfonate monooxygenase SsuD/methylene tetrahydromethanopterin reductase-like flavin-dependent oxidoreductase (luciferase family)
MTLGIGYRQLEYDLFDVDRKRRVPILERTIGILEQAWSGEPFEYDGQTVTIRPTPVQRPRPPIYIGGSTDASAVRAARIGDNFMPATPDLYEIYAAELQRLGREVPARPTAKGPLFLFISNDPERDWDVVAPHVMYTSNSNAEWAKERGVGATPYPPLADVADLKASPSFQVLTPADAVAYIEGLDPNVELTIHPLMGGLDPAVGTATLQLFVSVVLPALEASGRWQPPPKAG